MLAVIIDPARQCYLRILLVLDAALNASSCKKEDLRPESALFFFFFSFQAGLWRELEYLMFIFVPVCTNVCLKHTKVVCHKEGPLLEEAWWVLDVLDNQTHWFCYDWSP